MQKILIALSLFALLSTTYFIFQRETVNQIENEEQVTFKEFFSCQLDYPVISDPSSIPCLSSEDYEQTLNAFYQLTITPSEEVSLNCLKFYQLENSQLHELVSINLDDYFYNCYITEKVRLLANTNECFFKNYYAPLYLICGRFDQYAYPPYTPFNQE